MDSFGCCALVCLHLLNWSYHWPICIIREQGRRKGRQLCEVSYVRTSSDASSSPNVSTFPSRPGVVQILSCYYPLATNYHVRYLVPAV
ncbi:hypothetical protein F4777DRAFT_563023 [Nemania sp. FL0916]|nr:hypothetical protein F4777DRAFT_563023 [Nemania sp. FL0916]